MATQDVVIGILWSLYVVMDLAIIALLVRADFASRQNRALALLLTVDAAWILVVAAGFVLGAEWRPRLTNMQVYMQLTWPLLAANFVLVFPRPRMGTRGLWTARVMMAAAGVASCVWFALDHPAMLGPDSFGVLAHYGQITGILPILVAMIPLRDYVQDPERPGASALLLVSLAFAVWPSANIFIFVAGREDATDEMVAYSAAQGALLILLIGTVLWLSLRASTVAAATNLRKYGAFLGGVALLLLAVGLMVRNGADPLLVLGAVVGLNLSLPLLLGFAVLRYQLLGIEIKVRWSISHGTMAAAFIAAALIGSQFAENFLNTRYNWILGSLAAGLLAFAINPLQNLANRVAESALPGTKRAEDMKFQERLKVYEENVRIAWADGQMSKKERILLRNMRQYLGLDADQAEKIESRVMTG